MSKPPVLEFFYDCSSPWTYLAFSRVIPMCEELGVDIDWRPIIVGGVFNAVNQEVYSGRASFFTSDTPKLHYFMKDSRMQLPRFLSLVFSRDTLHALS